MGIKNSKYIGRVKPPIKPTGKPPEVIDLGQSNEVVNSNERKKYNKPRIAKAYGVKNNILIDDILYTTTFGEGNAHKLSKKTIKDDVEEIDKESEFKLDSNSPKLDVALKRGNSKQVDINNPQYRKKADIININPKINKLIFGDEFKNDNIHIQIAYNILDMNKIISLYYYNIVYAINNLVRDIDISDEDFIGMLSYEKTFEEYNPYIKDTGKEKYTYEQVKNESESVETPKGFYKFDKYARAAYPYFSVFKCYKGKSDSDNEESRKYNFNVLRILSFVRQSVAHSTIVHGKKDNEVKETMLNSLYRVNNENSLLPRDLIDIIDYKLDNDLTKINNNFNKNSIKNLWVLKKILNSNDDQKLLEDYYNFIMYKENKNLGINNTKVRESLFDYYNSKYNINLKKNKNYNSCRKKINQIYDYFIYSYLKKNKDKYIEKLRFASCYKYREEEKGKIYHDIAVDFDKYYKKSYNGDKIFNLIWESINNNIKNEISVDYNIDKISSKNFTLFSKIIYFISYFLETKEKNDLITALINKLDNIASLNNLYKVIKEQNVKYNLNYSMFEEASKIAKELRIIKNLSHMEAKLESAKGIIYIDVLRSLGYEESKEECQKIISSFESEWIGHPFRNFIVNNIISSNRYKYIVKYINPKYCNKYIKNENLIKHILNDIPDTQLNRYYFRITKCSKEDDSSSKENKVNVLYDKLLEVNFDNLSGDLSKFTEFKSMKTDKKTKTTHEEYEIKAEKIEDIKSLVTLYYTVIYLAVKNLVNINSVFIIGFECLERDYAISKNLPKKDVYSNATSELYLIKGNDQEKDTENSALEFYKKKNKHNYKHLLDNVNIFNSIPKIGEIFSHIRNNVMHMNIVNKAHNYFDEIQLEAHPKSIMGNSVPVYYDLYAYVLERMILEEYREKVIIDGKNYYNSVKKHYDKDLLKVLFIPFGYNLARYKNLTIRDLFYDQYKYLIEKKINEDSINK